MAAGAGAERGLVLGEVRPGGRQPSAGGDGPVERNGRDGGGLDALAFALLVAALAFGVHVLSRSAGLPVVRPAAFLQAARWGVVALVGWHWWHWWQTLHRP